ncbi:MAG TPA: AAA family ATPase [Candidatus Elarobacter sp.]|nr:AAA family ATPase [Candidatus Elarobacter sp.]
MLRVHLFGRPRLSLDETAFPIGGRPKVVPLLAYLLLHRGAPLPRQTVANALWPDEPEDEARANLRRHLNYLHHALPPAGAIPWLLADGGKLQWNPERELWLDVAEFERLAAVPEQLAEAVALYEDDLLVDVEEEWLDAERERLKGLHRMLLAALVAKLRAAREYAAALSAAHALLQHDPFREDALRSALLIRYESGDRAGALAEYERFAGALRDELDTAPMAETVALYEAILRDDVAADINAAPRDADERFAERPSKRSVRERFADGPAALPFVGRAAELDALRERWNAAAAGSGALILIGGEAGVGKTRLVRELVAACEAQGALVHAASTTFPETTPYQPFVALLRLAVPLAASVAVDPLWLSAIAALVPTVAEYAAELPPLTALDPARERLRLFEACVNLWTAIAARRPLVLVVEDLQSAGAATLALLEHLARRAQRARILIVATYREDELDLGHALRALRRRLEHDGAAARLALPRLSREAVETLLHALAGGESHELARALHARSEGNPFFLEEMLRDLAETGHVRIVERRWSFGALEESPVPPALRDAVGARIARLDKHAATLAEAAAVIGRAFDVELLRETTGWTEATVMDALNGLLDRRIVSESAPHGAFGYAFTHDLLRAVVYERIDEPARIRRHRRVAHVMSALYAEQGDDVSAELALHWDRGGEPQRAAEQYLRAAKHAASVYGLDEAAQQATRALELGILSRTRFEALLLRVKLAAAEGDRAAQARDIDMLARLTRHLDEEAVCTVLERRIDLANVTGERRRERVLLRLLERRVRKAGDSANQTPRYGEHEGSAQLYDRSTMHTRLLQCKARYYRCVSDFDAARGAFNELTRLAEEAGDRGRYVDARLAYADSYTFEGRLGEARAVLDELRTAVQADGDRAALVRTLIAFSRAALQQQDYAAMSGFAAEALEIARAIGDREGEALALHTTANGLVYTFRVGEARSFYVQAAELYERMSHRVGTASVSCDFGLFHTEIGLLDAALDLYARAREVAHEIGFTFVAAVERVNAGYCHRLRGEYELARSAAESALELARTVRSQPLESAALGVLGAAESALGEHANAIAHLEAGVELRRPSGATPRLGDNLCALALAHLRSGNVDAARAAADELLALYDANPKLAPQPAEWLLTAACVAEAHGASETAADLLRRADSVMRARASAIPDTTTRTAYLALPFNVAVAEALATRL